MTFYPMFFQISPLWECFPPIMYLVSIMCKIKHSFPTNHQAKTSASSKSHSFDRLSNDLLLKIFAHLPTDCLCRCAQVSEPRIYQRIMNLDRGALPSIKSPMNTENLKSITFCDKLLFEIFLLFFLKKLQSFTVSWSDYGISVKQHNLS